MSFDGCVSARMSPATVVESWSSQLHRPSQGTFGTRLVASTHARLQRSVDIDHQLESRPLACLRETLPFRARQRDTVPPGESHAVR